MKTIIRILLLSIFIFYGCKHDDKRVESAQVTPITTDTTAPVNLEVNQAETEFIKVDIPKKHLSEKELKYYADKLEGFMYMHGAKNIAAEDLAINLSDRIVSDINNGRQYNVDSILTVDAYHTYLKAYSVKHDSGGTRGQVRYPILVWHNEGKQYAYNLSRIRNFKIAEIHKLRKNLFLLIGYEKAYSNMINSIAYVVEIKGQRINTKYKAFVNRPYLDLYNLDYSFNQRDNILTGEITEINPYEDIKETFASNSRYGNYANDSIANNELFHMIALEYFETKKIHLNFVNGKFTSDYINN